MTDHTDRPLTPAAPLFRDPIYDGAADPTLIWNREERLWWMAYTNRRANVEGPGLGWCHGTDIGVASSRDGHSWLYRGTLQGLEFERGRNTFWAPEIIWHEGVYHMYVSYLRGVPQAWSGERHIVHLASHNLWSWEFQSIVPLSSGYVIDACVHRLPGGAWRMWYKDEADGSHTYAADSPDLAHWKVVGPVITDCAHEGPNVFQWHGCYWMITDPWGGLGVYRSVDGEHWERRRNILDNPGQRAEDGRKGSHADVVAQGERAYIFYFTHPEAGAEHAPPCSTYATRRTVIQVAQLEMVDGEITCDRDKPFSLELAPEKP